MTKENHSSKQEDDKEIEALKKKAENLQKSLDMTRKTIDHDKKFMLNKFFLPNNIFKTCTESTYYNIFLFFMTYHISETYILTNYIIFYQKVS